MSLLLDALRKADRERNQQQAPAGIGAGDSPGKNQSPLLWAVLALLAMVLLLLIALVIWLWPSQQSSGELQPAVRPTPEQNAPALDSAQKDTVNANQESENNQSTKISANSSSISSAATVESPDQVQPVTPSQVGEAFAAVTVTEPAASLASDKDSTATTDKDSAATKQTRAANSATAGAEDRDAVARLYSQNAQQQSAPVQQPEVQSEPPAQTVNPDNLDGYDNVGGVRSLPLAIQNDIPTLMYGQHNYRRGGDSNVVINGQTLREGERINGNIVVEVIAADGVVLRYQDHHFRLRALSSWVNM
ncbi:general secretion pathway protein GspB [Gilvimarinus sp. DA14]|uniref:general secretion pathway protein GspB n=1 Tax=Gilvimarinus sp. DA14 TaxID=2956798 RepID=UPI0020B68819|nr:general secretion pathway protein GspB [Gilvimarinus sp. DA14]UTF61037.1 general secretion pathway protein GspB [Gilvimarinus sp. DA14]